MGQPQRRQRRGRGLWAHGLVVVPNALKGHEGLGFGFGKVVNDLLAGEFSNRDDAPCFRHGLWNAFGKDFDPFWAVGLWNTQNREVVDGDDRGKRGSKGNEVWLVIEASFPKTLRCGQKRELSRDIHGHPTGVGRVCQSLKGIGEFAAAGLEFFRIVISVIKTAGRL